jgi:hypothetical protein
MPPAPSQLSDSANVPHTTLSPPLSSVPELLRPSDGIYSSNAVSETSLAHIPLSSESVAVDSADQSDAWTQVARHLASGKWPAPQVLPLVVWCLALFVLAL